MANTVTQQTLFSGSRLVIRKVHIVSDGTQESNLLVFDRSVFDGGNLRGGTLLKVQASGSSAIVTLKWDATTDDAIMSFDPSTTDELCFTKFGGISNPKSAGYTGDILLSTSGLALAEEVTVLLHVRL